MYLGVAVKNSHEEIVETIKQYVPNLVFLSKYLENFPNEVSIIRTGLINSDHEQNWLDLFKLQDFAKNSKNLAKHEIVEFTDLDDVPWSVEYVKDIVEKLEALKEEFGDDVGRFNEITVESLTSTETVMQVTGEGNVSYLTINRTFTSRFNNYNLLKFNILFASLTTGNPPVRDFVASNIEEVLNHEFFHKITNDTRLAANNEFTNKSDTSKLLLKHNVSNYAITNGDEALSEIFVAHKKIVNPQDNTSNLEIPEEWKHFFNNHVPENFKIQ